MQVGGCEFHKSRSIVELFQKFICFGSLVRPLLEVAKHGDDVTIMVIMLTMVIMMNGWFFVYSGSSVVHYQPLSLFARARNTSGGDNHTTLEKSQLLETFFSIKELGSFPKCWLA